MRRGLFFVILVFASVLFSSCTLVGVEESPQKQQEKAKELGFAEYLDIVEIKDRNLLLNNDLKDVYKNYAESKEDRLLLKLEPIDIFRLYNNAILVEDYETACSLINIPNDIDKDEFLAEWKNNEITKNNDKKLLKKYTEKKFDVFEVRIDDGIAVIAIQDNERYRLEKVAPGIWKIGWLALQ